MSSAADLQNSFELVKKLLPHLDECVSILDNYKKDFFSDEEGTDKEFTSVVLWCIQAFNEDLVDSLNESLENFNNRLTGSLFESLKTLHLHKPSRKAVEKVVGICPDALYDPDESEPPVISFAAKHAGVAPSYVKILLSIDPYQQNMPFLEYLVESDESDGENADANRVAAFKDIREMGFLKRAEIRRQKLLEHCDHASLPNVFDFLCSCDPYGFLLRFWEDEPFALGKGAFWDVSKVAVYFEAGFKYWPEIGGLLFLKNFEGTSVLDDAFEIYGEETIMKVLRTILSRRGDFGNFPILHHVYVKSPKYKDLFLKHFPWAYSLPDHSRRTLYQVVLASGTAEMKTDICETLTNIQLREKDPITTLYPFSAVAEDLPLCFKLLRNNPSVLDEESRHLVSQKKRKRLNFLSDNYKHSLSGMALKLVVQYLRPDDVLSCVQTCKEWNISIDDNVWAGIARSINHTSCDAIENVGMGKITYKDMVMVFVRNELPLWKVPEQPQPLKTDDVIIVVEISHRWKNSERKLLGSYSCLLSNLQEAKNMELHFRNSLETGTHIEIPANEIEAQVLQEIKCSWDDPRSNFIPMLAFHGLELKAFLMEKSTGRSTVLHDFAHVGKYFREGRRTIEGKRFSQSVTYFSGIPRTHEEVVKREHFSEKFPFHIEKTCLLQSIGLTLTVVPQPATKTNKLEPPKTVKQLRGELRKHSQSLEYTIVSDSVKMEFHGFDNDEELLSFLRRLPWQ